MHLLSITQAFVFGLLATLPLATAVTTDADTIEVGKRHVGSPASHALNIARAAIPGLEARHHTEAQIVAREAKAEASHNGKRIPQEPDEFGPEDSDSGEFGSWVDKREAQGTEAQTTDLDDQISKFEASQNRKRSPSGSNEFGPVDSESDEFGSWVDKREAQDTEAQNAAMEAQRFEDEASKNRKRSPQESGEDGSCVDKREAQASDGGPGPGCWDVLTNASTEA